MAKGKNRQKADQGGTSKEVLEFLSDPLLAKALARTDTMPVGWATGKPGIKPAKQRTVVVPSLIKEKTKSVSEAPDTSRNKNEAREDGEGLAEGTNDIEDIEGSEASSRSLGEDDSDSSSEGSKKSLGKEEIPTHVGNQIHTQVPKKP